MYGSTWYLTTHCLELWTNPTNIAQKKAFVGQWATLMFEVNGRVILLKKLFRDQIWKDRSFDHLWPRWPRKGHIYHGKIQFLSHMCWKYRLILYHFHILQKVPGSVVRNLSNAARISYISVAWLLVCKAKSNFNFACLTYPSVVSIEYRFLIGGTKVCVA